MYMCMNFLKKIFLFVFVFVLFFSFNKVNASINYNYSVESISISPEKPYKNIETTISIKLKNYSSGDLTEISEINKYVLNIEDFSQTEIILPTVSTENPIDNNEEFVYTIKGKFTSLETKEIYFKNDHSSNSKSLNVEVLPAEDLYVEKIEVSPLSPTINEDCQIKVKIKNSGKNDLKTGLGFYSYKFSFPDFIKDSLETPSISWSQALDSGDYIYYTFLGKFTNTGEKTLEFILDDSDQLKESDESNNQSSLNVAVVNKQGLDLIVDTIEIENEYALLNQDTEIVVKVKNIGEVSLVNGTGIGVKNISLYSPNFVLKNFTLDELPTTDNPLEPNEIFTYVFSGSFKETGISKIDVEFNKNNLLEESDFENNVANAEIMVYLNQEKADEFIFSNEKIEFKNSKEAIISWDTSKNTNSELIIKKKSIYSDAIITETINDKKEFSIEIDDLYPAIKYYFKVKAINGVFEKETEYIEFTTPADDNLYLDGNIELVKNNNKVTIKWKTNLLSSGFVHYKLKNEIEYQKIKSNDLSLDHEIILENLNGDYDYFVEFIDNNEVVTKSELDNFSVIIDDNNVDNIDDTDNTDDVLSNNNASDNESAEVLNDNSSNNSKVEIKNNELYNSLKGKIILKVESKGEAYYINPVNKTMNYLGRSNDAFLVMRSEGVGISNFDLKKIQIGLSCLSGVDSDGDGLPDLFEDAVKTDKNKKDSDGDGYEDKIELMAGYDPSGSGRLNLDSNFSENQKGKIFLQVENNGEAWYINANDKKRYFLGRPADAFQVMRNLGLGISNNNFESL